MQEPNISDLWAATLLTLMGGFVCWYRITRYIRQQDEEEAREDLEDRIVLLRESLAHGQHFGPKFWGRYHPSGRDHIVDFKESEKITEETEICEGDVLVHARRGEGIFYKYVEDPLSGRGYMVLFDEGREIHRYSRAQLMHKLRFVAKAETASSVVPLCSPFLLVAGVGVLWDIHYRR